MDNKFPVILLRSKIGEYSPVLRGEKIGTIVKEEKG
jgi:hypothetical protein